MPLSEEVLRTLQIYIFFFERSGVKLAVRSQQMPYIATVDNVARRAEPNNQAIVMKHIIKERMQKTLSQVNGCPQRDRSETEWYGGVQTFMWMCEDNIVSNVLIVAFMLYSFFH